MTYHLTPWGVLARIATRQNYGTKAKIRKENEVRDGLRKAARFRYGPPRHKRMSEEDFKEFCEANERHGLHRRIRRLTEAEKRLRHQVVGTRIKRKVAITLAKIDMPYAK